MACGEMFFFSKADFFATKIEKDNEGSGKRSAKKRGGQR